MNASENAYSEVTDPDEPVLVLLRLRDTMKPSKVRIVTVDTQMRWIAQLAQNTRLAKLRMEAQLRIWTTAGYELVGVTIEAGLRTFRINLNTYELEELHLGHRYAFPLEDLGDGAGEWRDCLV